MKRFFNILLTAMAMLAVFLFSAFAAMRLAIHGREVEVPNLAGLTLQEASARTSHLGLSLRLENKFYSTDVPSGHILGQFPAPGATVRSEWPIRVTESIGAQEVSIPDVTGQPERPASLALRRASLELGTLASIAAPGDPGVVLAQTPPPNASGVDRPRVSLLLSEPVSASPEAFVMPQLTGLSLSTAIARASAAGLRIAAAEEAAPSASGASTGTAPPANTYHDSFFVGAPPQRPRPTLNRSPHPQPPPPPESSPASPYPRATASSGASPSASPSLTSRAHEPRVDPPFNAPKRPHRTRRKDALPAAFATAHPAPSTPTAHPPAADPRPASS